jgi:large repetitive protein
MFNVTVVDTTPPSLDLPPTSRATGPSGAAVSYSASANDPVDGAITPSCSPALGGPTTVNCSATDAPGNKATGTFKVNVQYGFHGFFQPVDNNGVYNTARAGAASR